MDSITAEQAAFAWNQVEEETLSPKETSIDTLSRILNENKNTIFGKENKFENLRHEEFSLKVPLSRYNNHESYIERILQGERNVLSHTDVKSFFTSSGTTGKTKLIPHTTRNGPQESPGFLQLLEYRVTKLCKSVRPSITKEKLTGVLLVNKPPFYYDSLNRMIGPATAVLMQELVNNAFKDPLSWRSITHPTIHLIEKYDEFCYLTALYSLKIADLNIIWATFLPNMLSFFHVIENSWEQLISDIRLGVITGPMCGLSSKDAETIRSDFIPDMRRAKELEDIFSLGLHAGLIARIWPDLALVACAAGGSFHMYIPRLKELIGDNVIIYSPSMFGSEGYYGTNFCPGEHISLYYPYLRTNYFEFIEEKDTDLEQPSTLKIDQIQLGKRYELVLTNNGLYRFRVGDVIEVKSFLNKMPLFDMCYRIGSVINMVGEKTSDNHLMSVLETMEKEGNDTMSMKSKPLLIDFTTSVDVTGAAPQYVIYIELDKSDGDCNESIANTWNSERFEELLRLYNDQYECFSSQGRLLPVKVVLVSSGSFALLLELAKENGAAEMQFKVPRLLISDAQRELMAGRVLGVIKVPKSETNERDTKGDLCEALTSYLEKRGINIHPV